MKSYETKLQKIKFKLLTPGPEWRSKARRCQWCGAKVTKENKCELIKKSSNEQFAVSVGMIPVIKQLRRRHIWSVSLIT